MCFFVSLFSHSFRVAVVLDAALLSHLSLTDAIECSPPATNEFLLLLASATSTLTQEPANVRTVAKGPKPIPNANKRRIFIDV